MGQGLTTLNAYELSVTENIAEGEQQQLERRRHSVSGEQQASRENSQAAETGVQKWTSASFCEDLEFEMHFLVSTKQTSSIQTVFKETILGAGSGIPWGHEFKSQLLHVQSCSLLMHLGWKQSLAQVRGPLHTHERPRRSSWCLAVD